MLHVRHWSNSRRTYCTWTSWREILELVLIVSPVSRVRHVDSMDWPSRLYVWWLWWYVLDYCCWPDAMVSPKGLADVVMVGMCTVNWRKQDVARSTGVTSIDWRGVSIIERITTKECCKLSRKRRWRCEDDVKVFDYWISAMPRLEFTGDGGLLYWSEDCGGRLWWSTVRLQIVRTFHAEKEMLSLVWAKLVMKTSCWKPNLSLYSPRIYPLWCTEPVNLRERWKGTGYYSRSTVYRFEHFIGMFHEAFCWNRWSTRLDGPLPFPLSR